MTNLQYSIPLFQPAGSQRIDGRAATSDSSLRLFVAIFAVAGLALIFAAVAVAVA